MTEARWQRLRAWRERQLFVPSWAGLWLNPFYHARRGLLDGMQPYFPALTGAVLDVGCGRKPYRKFIPAREYIGMEIDTARTRSSFSADIYYDGRNFPFPNARFDGALCSQVFEHVFTPVEFLAEINRVLRPGGRLLLTVPFVWDEHEQPHDFARYSSYGLRALLQGAGFEIEAYNKSLADGRLFFQLANTYLHKVTQTRFARLNLASTIALLGPINVLGATIGRILPENADLYLDNIVLARKAAIVGP